MPANIPQGAPDGGMIAQILGQIRQEQMQRIKELGTAKMISATAPGDAINTGLAAFQKQKQLGSEEDLRQAQMQAAQATTAAQNIRNQAAQAEESHWEDINPQTGNTYRDDMLTDQGDKAHLDKQIAQNTADQQPELFQHALDLSDAQLDLAKTNKNQAIKSGLRADQQTAFDQFQVAAAGNAKNPNPQARADGLAQIQRSFPKLSPELMTSLSSKANAEADAMASSNAINKELATTSLPQYKTMANATDNTLRDVGLVTQLNTQGQQYFQGLRGSGSKIGAQQAGSYGGETPAASAARQGIVQTLRQMADNGDAQAGAFADSIDPNSSSFSNITTPVTQRIQTAVSAMAGRVQNKWNTEYLPQIDPSMQGRSEFTKTNQAVQGLSQLSNKPGSQKNTLNLTGGDGGGQIDNRTFTAGKHKQNSGEAAAAPSNLPTPNGTLQLPGMAQPALGAQGVPQVNQEAPYAAPQGNGPIAPPDEEEP